MSQAVEQRRCWVSRMHSKRVTSRAIALAFALLLSGCASPRIDWSPRIGTYTFDNAILELGPPDKQAKTQDGTVVADWLTERGYTYGFPSYGGASLFYYGGPPYPVYTHTSPDRFLRLTFGPDGTLKTWSTFMR